MSAKPICQVIQYVTFLIPKRWRSHNNHLKGHVFTIQKRSQSQNCQVVPIFHSSPTFNFNSFGPCGTTTAPVRRNDFLHLLDQGVEEIHFIWGYHYLMRYMVPRGNTRCIKMNETLDHCSSSKSNLNHIGPNADLPKLYTN